MNKTSRNVLCLLLLITGCSLSPVTINPRSNPGTEISAQQVLLDEARLAQVDVLATKNFNVATTYLEQAQNENRKGADAEDVLENVGYSKAYLKLATKEAEFANSRLRKIMKARREAIKAGARELPEQLSILDDDLRDLSTREQRVSDLKQASLQSNYFALELEAIKHSSFKKFKKL